MSHSLSFNNLIVNNLKIDYNKQESDYILKSGPDGLVSWVGKDSMISNNQFNHYVGELYGGGIVTAVWKENGLEKCLIAALQDTSYIETQNFNYWVGDIYFGEYITSTSYTIGNLVPWSNLNTVNGASWSVSGASNSTIITTQVGFESTINPTIDSYSGGTMLPTTRSGYSGAAQYCLNYINPDYGTGIWSDWYLPSIYELSTLFSNLGIINKTLSQYAQDSGRSLTDTTNSWNYYGNVAALINLPNNNSQRDNSVLGNDFYSVGYWSSTEASSTEAYAYLLNAGGDSGIQSSNNVAKYLKSNFLLTRPFRIADDTIQQIQFDGEYIVITYQFTDGVDLDTKTRMISPTYGVTPWNEANTYVNGTNGGETASNFVGYGSTRPWVSNNFKPNGANGAHAYDYTPSVTETIPATASRYNPWGFGNNVAGTYSILKSAGDNTGTGFESILVDITAFKFHFPTQQEMIIDCRAWWVNSPPTKPPGVNPVILGVTFYKGGVMSYNTNYEWNNNGYTNKISLASYGKVVPPIVTTTTPDSNKNSERIGLVKYNISTKLLQIIT